MQLGPNLVYKCPKCDTFIENGSLVAGNTFGEQVYSDGKRITPNFPEYPNLTICTKCNHIFKLSKLEPIGSYWGNDSGEEWKNVNTAKFLNLDEYFKALEFEENKSDECFIRFRIWWEYNDRVRNGNKLYESDEDKVKWENNINVLMNLLDINNIDDKLFIAELHRSIGNFDECLIIIESIDLPELAFFKEALLRNCLKRNQLVFQLK